MSELITSAGLPSATSLPWCSTTMRSERERTTSILCSTSRMVLSPRCLMAAMIARMVGTSSMLMPAVGSSNKKMSGSSASRVATSSLRWSPCDSGPATAPAGSANDALPLRPSDTSPVRRGEAGRGKAPVEASALVLDGQLHLVSRDLADEVEQIDVVRRVGLHAPLVHDLQGLMVFLAEDHLALGS